MLISTVIYNKLFTEPALCAVVLEHNTGVACIVSCQDNIKYSHLFL